MNKSVIIVWSNGIRIRFAAMARLAHLRQIPTFGYHDSLMVPGDTLTVYPRGR